MNRTEDQSPLVYVVVLHWRTYESTRRALQSLQGVSYPNYRVLVVDNCSGDGSIERLEAEFPTFTFLHNETNLGFARGCNRGLKQAFDAGADYSLLLNSDMEVPADFLQAAVDAAEADHEIGLVTGKILFGENRDKIWQAGGHIDRFRIQGSPRGWNETDGEQWDEACETEWGSGAMLLIPRHSIEKVGFLPEEYFFGSEEWDYSTAVRRAGLKIMYVPQFRGYHYCGGSYIAGDPILIVYNGIRNKMIYAEKYLPRLLWPLWKIAFGLYLLVWWPKRAHWGCHTKDDYEARLKAARLAYRHHRGVKRVELADLQRASELIGPTTTWGNAWSRAESTVTE